MTDEEVEAQEFGEQIEVAAACDPRGGRQLLQAGELYPQFIVLAVAKVAGELGAATALASGQEAEELLDQLPTSCARVAVTTKRRSRSRCYPLVECGETGQFDWKDHGTEPRRRDTADA